jgi:coenzyme F420-reducing hydrogenase beta subunit
MWHRYAKEVRQKHGDQAITGVSFRDKRAGTGDETFTMRMQLEGGETYSSSNKNNDTFYRFYLGNECMNKPCYEGCKYKYTNSAADIRIGDLWSSRYPTNDRPLSAVLALTETGREVIRELQGRCVTQAESVDLVADGQMRTPLKTPALRDRVIDKLARGCSLGSVVRYIDTVRRFNRIKGLLKRVVLRGFS